MLSADIDAHLCKFYGRSEVVVINLSANSLYG